MDIELGFRERVYEWVAQIPQGKVATYGQIAALAGQPRAARIVGQIAAQFGPAELPWQRVIYKDGRLAGTFPGGRTHQADLLREDGVEIDENYIVDVNNLLWNPQ